MLAGSGHGGKYRHMLKTKVKASAVTNLTDARYFAARGVTWLGFDLTPGTPAHVPPMEVMAIAEWVDGVAVTGEFAMPSDVELRAAVDLLKLDAIQVGMFTAEEVVRQAYGVQVLHEIIWDADDPEGMEALMARRAPMVDAFVLRLDAAGLDWHRVQAQAALLARVQRICASWPVILSMPFEAEATDEVLRALQPMGINVFGGEEEKTGYKSFDELDELFDRLELD